MANLGAKIVMVRRNKERTDRAVELIKSQIGNSSVSCLLADLSSLSQVRGLAQEFKDKYGKLDILLNNAGALFLTRKVSADGYDMTVALIISAISC